ncbi:MAG: FimV/HubP family polar landmark protein [Bryobacteraceae bacterium]
MTRREFAAAIGSAGLWPYRSLKAAPFAAHYARANPYDAALRFVEPGSDEFKGEKAAIALEERVRRIFAGREPAPAALRPWLAKVDRIRAARFYALPDSRLRFEIKIEDAEGLSYHTGAWRLPDFTAVSEDVVTSPKPYFRDVTGHVFGAASSFARQLLPGNLYWRSRIDSAAGLDVYGNQGIAVGDIDGDGIDEIYVCQPGGFPNRLYKIGPDGTAVDITERAGLAILDDTTCALFADFRNSGHQDLVVLLASGPLLFLNQGDGAFREQPDSFHFESAAQGSFTGMAAADYNRDGRLDLYLCCYVFFQSEDQYRFPAPYHDARNGPPNFLFQNRAAAGGVGFHDVTAKTGLNQNNDRFSFAPAWCDADGDGWPDLYVANDFGRNNFYRNRNGNFRDEAEQAGVEDIGPGMSASWFDYDGDGRPDVYASNMWTAAGQRVVRDPAFQPAAANPEAYRRHTKGNSLYRNRGDGTFEETGPGQGVEMGRWAWSSGGFDFDLDGAPEILIATGMTTNELSADLNSFFWRQVVAKTPATQTAAPDYENGWSALNQLIRGDASWSGHEPNVFYVRRDGRYHDASGVSGLDVSDDTRAFAVTDFDGDGNPDIVLKSRRGPQIRAFQNDCAGGKPAVAIVLRGTKSNRDAIGAKVAVNGHTQFLLAGGGFLSQHSKRLHFGLGGKARAEVEIRWPSGVAQRLSGLEPGFTYTIVEGKEALDRAPFRKRTLYSDTAVMPKNAPEFADTWLLEPVPTPEKRKGPGFLLLYSGACPALPSFLPFDAVDLGRQNDEVAAAFALFRRYLFEYRTELSLPLLLLIDSESRARKIYASIPPASELQTDLGKIERGPEFALPFTGRFHTQPRRNYYKLGAAFYWAGYPARALPYLQETLRGRPDNWKALQAIARIHQELGQDGEARKAYARLAEIPSAPRALAADAINELGLMAAEENKLDAARELFEKAIGAQRDHAGAINNLGVLYAKMGKTDDAIAAFRYGMRMAPGDESMYLNLARVYVAMGDREQARAILNQLLEAKPGSAIAGKALAELEGR